MFIWAHIYQLKLIFCSPNQNSLSVSSFWDGGWVGGQNAELSAQGKLIAENEEYMVSGGMPIYGTMTTWISAFCDVWLQS